MDLDEYKRILKDLIKLQAELEHARIHCIEMQNMVLFSVRQSGLISEDELKDLEQELHVS